MKTVLQSLMQLLRTAVTMTCVTTWCFSVITISLNNLTPVFAEDNATTAAPEDKSGLDKDAVLGLALGFGFFVATVFCCCITWCLCCKALSDPEKAKVMPLQFRTADRLDLPREEDSPDLKKR